MSEQESAGKFGEPDDVQLARKVLASKVDHRAEDTQLEFLARATIRYYRAMIGHA